jgi:hypothetical protein
MDFESVLECELDAIDFSLAKEPAFRKPIVK